MPLIEVNGAAIHVHVTGKGIPILCIHPPLLTAETFNYQKAQLSDEFQIVTFDIRGHGYSKASKQSITYPLIVEDIKQLMKILGMDKAYLCGYSTGGSIVLEALLTYPDLFLGGIVVSGMSEVRDWYNKSRIWLASQLSAAKATRMLLNAAVSSGNADMRFTFNNLYASAQLGIAQHIHEYYTYSLGYNCTRRLPYIQHPMLLIYGQKDKVFHPYAHLLHHKLPNSSLYFLKDAKHQVVIKQASRMNDLVRLWIASLGNSKKTRNELDLEIAHKMNPIIDMYKENEESSLPHR
ncbi:AB hydrolase superfamily protein YvaM [compost metagenome]